MILRGAVLLFCATLLFSCSLFKSSKKDDPPSAAEAKKAGQTGTQAEGAKSKEVPKEKQTRVVLDSSIIDKGEDEVRNKFGEPDIVSKTPENQIIWTYKPKWKLWPDNADTVYVEFTDGKVARVVRAVR